MANSVSKASRVAVAYLSCALLLACTNSAAAAEALSLPGETMGTTYVVKIADPPANLDADALHKSIDAALETVNDQMSTWRPDSELSRFNAADTTDWVSVSPALVTVIAESQRISAATDGAFDVTVGPLISLWGFDHEGRPEKTPTAAEIAAARARCGYRKLDVRADPPALRKSRPDLSVNLSAIAKGYGVDVVADLLDEAGLKNYMVEIGGEVRTRGRNAADKDWHIGVEAPRAGLMHEIYRVVSPGERGMATSGDYRNFFEQDGKIYSHTIDPKTGRPIESGLASATVLADSCMTADAWARAMMSRGPERGMHTAAAQKLSVMLIAREAGGNFRELSNAGFGALVSDTPVPAEATSPLTLFLIALSVFALALIGMSVGVIVSNRRIKGSCGGLNNMTDDEGRSICDICTTPPEECDRVRAAVAEGAGRVADAGEK